MEKCKYFIKLKNTIDGFISIKIPKDDWVFESELTGNPIRIIHDDEYFENICLVTEDGCDSIVHIDADGSTNCSIEIVPNMVNNLLEVLYLDSYNRENIINFANGLMCDGTIETIDYEEYSKYRY